MYVSIQTSAVDDGAKVKNDSIDIDRPCPN